MNPGQKTIPFIIGVACCVCGLVSSSLSIAGTEPVSDSNQAIVDRFVSQCVSAFTPLFLGVVNRLNQTVSVAAPVRIEDYIPVDHPVLGAKSVKNPVTRITYGEIVKIKSTAKKLLSKVSLGGGVLRLNQRAALSHCVNLNTDASESLKEAIRADSARGVRPQRAFSICQAEPYQQLLNSMSEISDGRSTYNPGRVDGLAEFMGNEKQWTENTLMEFALMFNGSNGLFSFNGRSNQAAFRCCYYE